MSFKSACVHLRMQRESTFYSLYKVGFLVQVNSKCSARTHIGNIFILFIVHFRTIASMVT
jgi:hypothetical protein